MVYAGIIVVSLCAGILQGVTGFGSGIAMMVVLPVFFPLNQAAGVSCAIAIILSILMVARYRKHIQIRKVLWPAILYMGSSGISIYFSAMVNQALMKKVFGVFLVLLSIYYLFLAVKQSKKPNFLLSVVFIAVSGVCDGLFGIGGPLMVLYYLSRTQTKEEYLGTIQALFLTNLVYGTILRIANHILTPLHLPYIGIGMIGIILGLAIANKIVDRADGEKIKRVTYVVIGISGILNLL